MYVYLASSWMVWRILFMFGIRSLSMIGPCQENINRGPSDGFPKQNGDFIENGSDEIKF
jgi:hypothetical protein